MSEPPPRSLKSLIGLLLCRVIVPAWILTGALFKLLEANPALLPKQILKDAHRLEIDLDVLLATFVALEFLAVAVLVLLGRFARVMAAFMLMTFCAVLLREIAQGHTSCGCLGAKSPSPWVMLALDGGLLVGVLLFPAARLRFLDGARWPYAAAAMVVLVGAGVSYAALIPRGAPPPPPPPPVAAWTPQALPRSWFESDYDAWIGRPWQSIELFRFMPSPPAGLDEPKRYVVFYGRTCEHCQEMFQRDLAANPELCAMVTAIEVPAAKDMLTAADAWSMPATACTLTALPVGTEWIITTPLALRIENGVVACVTEARYRGCLELPAGEEDTHDP